MVRILNLQKGVNMFNVDNSGKGNCLYYAYSISLMYYLRAKNNVRITEDIFKKLGLRKKVELVYENYYPKTMIGPLRVKK